MEMRAPSSAIRIALARNTKLVLFASVLFAIVIVTFVILQENRTWREQIEKSNLAFSKTVAISLWHFDYRAVEEQATEAARFWGMARIVVKDQFGSTIVDTNPSYSAHDLDEAIQSHARNGARVGEVLFWYDNLSGIAGEILKQALIFMLGAFPILAWVHWRMGKDLQELFGNPLSAINSSIARGDIDSKLQDVDFGSHEFRVIFDTYKEMLMRIKASRAEQDLLARRSNDILTSVYNLMEETEQSVIIETDDGPVYTGNAATHLNRSVMKRLLYLFVRREVTEGNLSDLGLVFSQVSDRRPDSRSIEVLTDDKQCLSLRFRVLPNGFHAISAVNISKTRRTEAIVEAVLELVNIGVAVFSTSGALEFEKGMPITRVGESLPSSGSYYTNIVDELLKNLPNRPQLPIEERLTLQREVNEQSLELTFLSLPGGYDCIVHADVTEKRFLESGLAQMSKMRALGQLTSGVAHDFNNLLSIIISCLEMVVDAHDFDVGGGKNRDFINTAMGAALQGASVTRQLLALSSRQKIDAEETIIDDLIVNNSNMLKTSLNPDVHLSLELESTGKVIVDGAKLVNAILNVVLNANAAIGEHGTIIISTRDVRSEQFESGFGTEISITDSGPGIPQHIIDRVFEPFFTTKAVGEGSGLGLAMLKGFIEQSDGTVELQSSESGLTVSILLPSHDSGYSAGAPIEMCSSKHATEHGGTIILVDDNQTLLKVWEMFLTGQGYQVFAYDMPEIAVGQIGKIQEPDVLIVDFQMPGMNGIDVSKSFLAAYPDLHIIMCSGNLSDEDEAVCREIGISDNLQKPVALNDIRKHVTQALAERAIGSRFLLSAE